MLSYLLAQRPLDALLGIYMHQYVIILTGTTSSGRIAGNRHAPVCYHTYWHNVLWTHCLEYTCSSMLSYLLAQRPLDALLGIYMLQYVIILTGTTSSGRIAWNIHAPVCYHTYLQPALGTYCWQLTYTSQYVITLTGTTSSGQIAGNTQLQPDLRTYCWQLTYTSMLSQTH